MDLLRSMNAETGTAVILISHNIALVSRFCSRVLVMYGGRIVEYGLTRDVFAQPRHPYTAALLNAVPRIDRKLDEGLATIEGRPPDLASLPTGCAFHPRCQVAMQHCKVERPPEFSTGPDRAARCWRVDLTTATSGQASDAAQLS